MLRKPFFAREPGECEAAAAHNVVLLSMHVMAKPDAGRWDCDAKQPPWSCEGCTQLQGQTFETMITGTWLVAPVACYDHWSAAIYPIAPVACYDHWSAAIYPDACRVCSHRHATWTAAAATRQSCLCPPACTTRLTCHCLQVALASPRRLPGDVGPIPAASHQAGGGPPHQKAAAGQQHS